MDITQLILQMSRDGTLQGLAQNRRAQFGTRGRRYIGATILPEQLKTENAYREDAIKYRTLLANAGTRYSPVQKKQGAFVGHMDVMLAEQDIGSDLTSKDYDALLALLNSNASMDAMASVIDFVNTTTVMPLVEVLEKYRWDAIVNAKVELRGDNGYSEDVGYPDPANHRVTVTNKWNVVAGDPFTDIFAIVNLLATKGYNLSRIVTSRKVVSAMAANAKVIARAGHVTVSAGSLVATQGRVTLATINSMLAEDGLPPIELYDLLYRTASGTGRFMPEDSMTLLGTTGSDVNLDLGDNMYELLTNTLGYTGIGRAAGQSGPGRVIMLDSFKNKPPRIEAQGWQTALPVILEPESFGVLKALV